MADVRCVQCGRPVNLGYLCDACIHANSLSPHQVMMDPYADTMKVRRYDVLTLFTAASVFVAACVAGFLFIKFKPSLGHLSGDSAPAPATVEAAAPTNRVTYQATAPSSLPPGRPLPPPAVAQQQPQAQTMPLGPIPTSAPVAQIADSVPINQAYVNGAQNSLSAFLSDYCSQRASITGMSVQVSKTTWLAGGAGVVVELQEGTSYRIGTAQYAPQSGWRWLTRPD